MSDLGCVKFVMPFGVKWRRRVGICIQVGCKEEDGPGNIILEIITIYK